VYSCALGEALLYKGDMQEAQSVLESGLEIALVNQEFCYCSELYRLLADVALSSGDKQRAHSLLKESIQRASAQKMLFYELRSLLDYTSLKLMDGDLEGVGLLRSLLKGFRGVQGVEEIEEARELISEFE
jgi:hypothetical protein